MNRSKGWTDTTFRPNPRSFGLRREAQRHAALASRAAVQPQPTNRSAGSESGVAAALCHRSPNARVLVRGILALLCCTASLLTHAAAPAPVKAAAKGAPAPVAVDLPAPAWVPGYRVRFPLRLIGDFTNEKAQTQSVIARLPAAGWLRPDGADICVQRQDGTVLPVAVLSHQPDGETLIQFARHTNDPVYWAYAGNPKLPHPNVPPLPEGITVEFRNWTGTSLASWADVVGSLKENPAVIGNAFVDQVVQNVNPARPDNVRNFAASYRGFLRIPEDGAYKFYLGAENAAFLFINTNRVFEQIGGARFTTRIPVTAWREVELTAGVHPFEVHHVCGPAAAVANCTLYLKRDTANKKLAAAAVPAAMFAPATRAEAAGIEGANGAPAMTFAWGVDDTLSTPGITLHLARFEAHGTSPDPAKIQWDFGDGTRGTGRSPTHAYFKSGEYRVTLNAGGGAPPVTQRIYVWTAPTPTSPHSLERAVSLLSADDWSGWDAQRFNSAFDFLLVSEQPNRWPLVERLARHLLAQADLDVKRRVALQTTLMEALARQGRGAEAMALMDEALKVAGKVPSLRVTVLLKGADLQWNYLKEFQKAAQLYESIITDHRGLGHPAVREAAIHWGDLFTQAGDLVQAAERYRLAKSLGGERFAVTGQNEAIQRGALLRITEQKLRTGDVRGTRLLLERLELDFPEQKLEGMYRFLRAETDRFAGRYEDAIRHYEVLLKLRQWAGFRDRAMHGLADCALRQEDFPNAQAWFEKLRETFPDYFTQHKLTPVFNVVKARAERAVAARTNEVAAASGTFRGHVTGFELGEAQTAGRFDRVAFLPMLGMDGPTVASGRFSMTKDLRNVPPDSACWVEFWYRKQGNTSLEPYQYCYMNVWMYAGADGPATNPTAHVLVPLDRASYGQWRKAAVRIKTPLAPDALLKLELINITGTVQIDGLKILPVSDRQSDSLRSFIEAEEVEQ